LKILNEVLEPQDHTAWLDQIATWRRQPPSREVHPNGALLPQYVIERLHAGTGGRAIVTTDVGQHQMWAAQYFRCDLPNQWITSGGLGTMGYGVPSALGAALGCPDRTVWSVVGDGGVQMTIFELATLVQENANVKVAIVNNGYLGMVRQWQQLFHNRNYSETPISSPDFMLLAQAYGIQCRRVLHPGDVDEAVEWAQSFHGPAIIEFVVNQEENVYPMIPSGGSVSEMIEEDLEW
jgi:acetolactate synthase-1/2/3 large subunit